MQKEFDALWAKEHGWGDERYGIEYIMASKFWDAAVLAERTRMAAAHLKDTEAVK